MKKIISIILSIAMLIGIASAVDLTAYAAVEKGKCGDNVSYSFDNVTGVLTISGTGKMSDSSYSGFCDYKVISVVIENGVTSIGNSAFEYCKYLTSVSISDTVTSIGNGAFGYCTNLTSVSIPDNVITIGDEAFKRCTSLTIITLPDSVTSIGDYAFCSCENLINIEIGDGITSIGDNAFSDCENLTSIEIGDNLMSLGEYAFNNCESLTTLTIGNKITSIKDYTFFNCTGLKNITIPDSVTSIGKQAFYGCESLISITIPNSVKSIDRRAFDNCKSLESLTISAGITSIGEYAFSNCESLTNVEIPNSITSISGYLFEDCTKLTSITIPDSVTSIEGSAFSGCSKLNAVYYSGTKEQYKSISISSGGNNYVGSAVIYCNNGCLFNNSEVTIDGLKYQISSDNTASIIGYTGSPKSVNIQKTIIYAKETLNVTSIGSYAFSNCASLESVTIPDSITSIGYYAFNKCYFTKDNFVNNSSVKVDTNIVDSDDNGFCVKDNVLLRIRPTYASGEVQIPNSITSIGEEAFSSCTNMTSVTLPEGLSNIEFRTFYNCTNLKNVTIPNSVRSIGNSAFEGCTSLTSVTIPDGVTSISYRAFNGCTSLTIVAIPDSITTIGDSAFNGCTSLASVTIPDSVTEIGDSAFYNCTSLSEFNVDENNKNYCSQDGVLFNKDKTNLIQYPLGNTRTSYSIPDGVKNISGLFSKCTNLVSVTIPDSVTSMPDRDFVGAFSGCTNLKNVTIGNGITRIGDYTFYDCTSLADIVLPDGVTEIGDYAFKNCASLKNITIPNSVTNIGYYAFGYGDNLTDIYYGGTKSQWQAIKCESGNGLLSHAIIHCSDGAAIPDETIVTIDGLKYCLYSDYTADVIGYSTKPESSITIPKEITYAGVTLNVVNIKKDAFEYCTDLTDVYYSGTKSQWNEIIADKYGGTDKAFEDDEIVIHCSDGLIFNNIIVTQDNVYYNILKNGNGACVTGYEGEPSSVKILDKITYAGIEMPVISIDYSAFRNCYTLENITIGKNIKYIYACAFEYCFKLKDVYYSGSQEEWKNIKISKANDYLTQATIHYNYNSASCESHTWDNGVVTAPASCVANGSKLYTCTVCKATKTEIIPATGHNFANNAQYCLNGCGTVNPNYVAPTQPATPTTPTAPAPTQPADPTQPTAQATVSKPKSTSIKKVKAAKKAVSVEWKKVSAVNGYEIQVATDKKFKKNKKTVTIKKQKTTKTTVKKLKSKKKYYVRIRTYKTVNGKKVYSSWSSVKSVKTK